MSVGVRYAHKWIDYAIEAVCDFTPSGEEDCGVNNPGFGSELGTYPLGRSNPAQPPAVRDYDGIEVRLRKRLSNRWSADVSYLLQLPARQLVGHRELGRGGRQPAAELRPIVQPAVLLVRRRRATRPTGRLGTDRPHQFKVQATYDLPWGTMVGVNTLVESGVPRSTIMSQKNISFFPYGRGDLGRTPTFSQVDLLLQQDFRLPGNTRVIDRRQRHQPLRSEDGDAAIRERRTGMTSTSRTRRSSAGSIPRRVAAAQNFRPRRALRHGQRLPGSEGRSGCRRSSRSRLGVRQDSGVRGLWDSSGSGSGIRRSSDSAASALDLMCQNLLLAAPDGAVGRPRSPR